MTKRSQRCPSRGERDQHGCIYGFISMFDFRNGRTTQKLLPDRRRGSKPPGAGDGDAKYKLGKSTSEATQGAPMGVNNSYSLHDTNGKQDNEERTKKKSDTGTPSVKTLLEQAMINELDIKNIGNAEAESREFYTEHKAHRRKNHKKKNRSHSKSCEKLDVDKMSEREQPSSQKSEKNHACAQYDHYNKVNGRNPDHQEKVIEAIRLLISQKFIDGNHVMEDVNIQSSEELAAVLHNLTSSDELLQKLVQRPKSEMVKYIQDLCMEQEERNAVERSKGAEFPEQNLQNSRKSGDVTNKKHRKLFGRKAKSPGKSSSVLKKVSQASDEIVILKPGPASFHNPGNERLLVSSSESDVIVRNKGLNDRVGSHYFFAEIKRKLKSAMGKDIQTVSTDSISNRSPNNRLPRSNSDKTFKESFGRNSPGKDHFLVEKIPKHTMTVKKGHKIGKFSDCESSTENETVDYTKQRASTLYIEAKRHLSQMLSNDYSDEDLQSIHVLKPLGKILSLPEYGISPIASPQLDLGQRFLTDHVLSSANDEFKNQDNGLNHATSPNLEGWLLVSDKIAHDNAQRPSTSKSNATDGTVDGINTQETCNSVGNELISEGVKTVEPEIECEEGHNTLSRIPETNTSSNVGDEQNSDMYKRNDEAQSSGQDLCTEQQQHILASPFSSPSIPSNNAKDEDKEDAELLERPSPVSVLEPLFIEEDVSPVSIGSRPVELPVQPLRIQFEEMDYLATDLSIHFKTCTDDWESIFQYVNAVLRISGLNWDDYYIKLHSSDQLLDPLLFDEVDFFPNQHSFDKKLIFDCINEVLLEVYWQYFGGASGLSSLNPSVRPVPALREAIYEVCTGVYWHLSAPMPHNLDKIIRKDMAKLGTWMDLRYDTEIIAVEICELISEDLMGETLLSFTKIKSI